MRSNHHYKLFRKEVNTMATTVVGMFKYQDDAESAVREFAKLGYDPKGMSLVMKDVKAAQRIKTNYGTKVAEGAAAGAVTGGAALGLAGLLIGTGVLTLPGLGALFIGGPVASALGLTGAAAATTTGAVTGAVGGGIVGALVGMGASPEVAKEYEEDIKGGGILLAVPTRDQRTEEVRTIFEKHKGTSVRQLDMPAGDTSNYDEAEVRHYGSA